ncbi:MAG: inositol monophosphatase family protein [Pseudolabrys sp.]|nr:inositol monophosphatase family protein [Pseudolabrys sp.]MDP2298499.1 inositol monophosphatase family protein [Pseudolabrys sp.]
MRTATDGPEITPRQAADLLDALCEIVSRAAQATLAIPYSSVAHRLKDDQSPVTAADEASEAIILEGLARVLPGVPVIAEESVAKATGALAPRGPLGASFLLVDPLDGTKEFLAGRGEFTVNVALVTNGVPIAGIVAAPAQGLLWRGVVGGKAEWLRLKPGAAPGDATDRRFIAARKAPARLTAAISRTHLDPATEDFLSRLPLEKSYPCGSSVKFCHIAEGVADVYPRLAPTREWDIAAGCAILAAAGGVTTAPDGGLLTFGNVAADFLVPAFIAWGDPRLSGLSEA